jgi:RNA polymerase sigma-70 factor (ECF subfamily)
MRLIVAICGGEKELFHDLIRPYQQIVYRMAFSLLRNEADAEDVAQEACVKAYLNLNHFRMESGFSTWLIAIVLNEARGLIRKRKRKPTVSLDSSTVHGDVWFRDVPDGRDTPVRQLLRRETQMLIHEAISQLPAIYRAVFQLRELDGHSIHESAEMLGVTEAVVKVRLHRARRMLQRQLITVRRPDITDTEMKLARSFVSTNNLGDSLVSQCPRMA